MSSLCPLSAQKSWCVPQCHGASLENGADLGCDSDGLVHARGIGVCCSVLFDGVPIPRHSPCHQPSSWLKPSTLYTSAPICQWKSERRGFVSRGSLVSSNCSFWDAQYRGSLNFIFFPCPNVSLCNYKTGFSPVSGFSYGSQRRWESWLYWSTAPPWQRAQRQALINTYLDPCWIVKKKKNIVVSNMCWPPTNHLEVKRVVPIAVP